MHLVPESTSSIGTGALPWRLRLGTVLAGRAHRRLVENRRSPTTRTHALEATLPEVCKYTHTRNLLAQIVVQSLDHPEVCTIASAARAHVTNAQHLPIRHRKTDRQAHWAKTWADLVEFF